MESIQVEDLPRHVLEAVACDYQKQHNHEAASSYLSSRVFRDKMSLSEVLDECESIMLKAALEFTGGNRSAAAGLLRISERTLYNKLHHCTGPVGAVQLPPARSCGSRPRSLCGLSETRQVSAGDTWCV